MRQALLVSLAGLPHENPLAAVKTIRDALGIRPLEPSSPRARFYSFEDAVAILVACRLRGTGYSPASAAEAIHRYHSEQGRVSGGRLLDRQVEIALNRLDRHARARLVGTLLTLLLPDADLPPGTIVYVEPAAAHEDVTSTRPEWADQRLEERLQRPRDEGCIAIVGERDQILFTESLSSANLAGRNCLFALVPRARPEFLVLVAASGEVKPKARVARSGRGSDLRGNEMSLSADDERLARRLLEAIGPAFDRVKVSAGRALHGVRPTSRQATLPGQNDMMLWLLSRFGAEIAADATGPAHSLILEFPENVESEEPPALAITASSDGVPWSTDTAMHPLIRNGQLLSGYSSLTNTTLVVWDSSQNARDRLISHYESEVAAADSAALTCVAVPISIRDRPSSPVMYVWKRAADPDPSLIRVLQVLAPVIGELIQRRRATDHAVLSSRDSAVTSFAAETILHSRLVEELTRMGEVESDVLKDERLVLVVITAWRGARGTADDAKWLSEQWQFVVPRLLMLPVLQASLLSIDLDRIVVGSLPQGGCVLLIPNLLGRRQLEELRKHLPRYVNGLPAATTEGGAETARIGAFVVDMRWRPVRERIRSSEAADLAKDIIDYADATAKVIPHIAEAYRCHIRGDWPGAQRSVAAGLAIAPQHPHLLENASQFSIYLGKFKDAQRFADRLVATRAAPVVARCLEGDAFLGRGMISWALAEYARAADEDRQHPLPPYSRGFALLAVARLLRQEAGRRAQAVNSGTEGTTSRGTIVEHKIDEALELATAALEEARLLAGEIPPMVTTDERTVFGPPLAFALYQLERCRRDAGASVAALLEARQLYPRDDLIQRELVVARMWHEGIGRDLYERCAQGKLLLESAPPAPVLSL